MIWTKGLKANRRTLSYGAKAGVRGRLTNSAGQPITGAKVMLLSRDLRQGASLIPRSTFTTDGDGRFTTTLTASASRLLQFAWLSHANDIRFAANGYLTLQARASSTLSRLHPPPAGRPVADDQRPAEGRLARRRPGRRPGPREGLQALRDVRGHDDVGERALQGPLPLPQLGLARALVRLPRPHPPRGQVPVRDRLFADCDRQRCAEK